MRRGASDFWLHADASGNVLALTNAGGAVVERYEYDYGQMHFLDAAGNPLTGPTQSPAGNPILFHSLRYDPETRFFTDSHGVYQDPQTGR